MQEQEGGRERRREVERGRRQERERIADVDSELSFGFCRCVHCAKLCIKSVEINRDVRNRFFNFGSVSVRFLKKIGFGSE